MKRSAVNEIAPEEKEAIATLPKNGSKDGKSKTPEEIDLTAILTSLQSMRDGDFSVRLPGTWVGLAGKIADTFNDIVSANQHMSEELKRVGQVVGKQRAGNQIDAGLSAPHLHPLVHRVQVGSENCGRDLGALPTRPIIGLVEDLESRQVRAELVGNLIGCLDQ